MLFPANKAHRDVVSLLRFVEGGTCSRNSHAARILQSPIGKRAEYRSTGLRPRSTLPCPFLLAKRRRSSMQSARGCFYSTATSRGDATSHTDVTTRVIHSHLGDPSSRAPALRFISFTYSFSLVSRRMREEERRKNASCQRSEQVTHWGPTGVGVHLGGGAPCDVHGAECLRWPLPTLAGIENFRQSNH